jgi:hypothetical protein
VESEITEGTKKRSLVARSNVYKLSNVNGAYVEELNADGIDPTTLTEEEVNCWFFIFWLMVMKHREFAGHAYCSHFRLVWLH